MSPSPSPSPSPSSSTPPFSGAYFASLYGKTFNQTLLFNVLGINLTTNPLAGYYLPWVRWVYCERPLYYGMLAHAMCYPFPDLTPPTTPLAPPSPPPPPSLVAAPSTASSRMFAQVLPQVSGSLWFSNQQPLMSFMS
eukprot:c8389_g1_i1.p2 GENE.c8389_g1_i1~~c8389_g1_i1.p2  ORF type:complete len:153 (+),score=43.67 c8389_g1_i1:49-459(+)